MNALSPCAWEQLLDKSYPSSDTAQHQMQPSQMIGIREIRRDRYFRKDQKYVIKPSLKPISCKYKDFESYKTSYHLAANIKSREKHINNSAQVTAILKLINN